ncbi:hypothetical protein M9Y10_019525 [Tritrichomonas musculus]|uniref:Helicase C-terminal domain-containing protein n=1 Tax=Tritrichomonas musculus TaxID=1915356 RepID=A0ABR2HGL7_9EUKA
MSYVDVPDKKQKHPHYEHRTAKLDLKDNEFSSKKFQQVRKVSTHKKLLKSFGRIGMCLNNRATTSIPTEDLNKVCFIIMNDYDDDDKELGVGPLNDGYLVGLKHHRLGFKVFYLYNSNCTQFTNFLSFLMTKTTESLTVFYSGRDDNAEGIEFDESTLSKGSISHIISSNNNDQLRLIFITDTIAGGSVFDIDGCQNAISFSVQKTNSNVEKEVERSHGIFTYYFCKIISDCPNITPNRLVERMNPSLTRFNEVFTCEFKAKELGETPIFN